MEINETPDRWVLCVKTRLGIPDIKQAAIEYAPQFEKQIVESAQKVAGPWLFVSHNLPRDSKTFFDWQMCRPVEKPERYDGAIELHHLESIIVASTMYQGSLRSLFTQGYAPLVAEIEMSRHIFSGESREVYHGWNGPGASYQRVEIQFGLAR